MARRRARVEVKQPAAKAARFGFLSNGLLADWFLIFFAVLIAYAPAIRGGLVWDDNAHVTRPELQSLHGLFRIWFDLGATQQYYPLLHSAFWLQHQLWGDNVVGYHLVSLIFHATAAWLVVVILRRLSLRGALLAGLVFALHPFCVEAVAWISEQKSTLSAVFYLASMVLYLKFDQTRRRSAYLWALGLFGLALLTKTVAATLPAALLVILWWQRGRLDWRRDAGPLLPWFPLGAGAGLFTAWVEKKYVGAQGLHFLLSPLQRLLIAGRAVWFYFAKIIFPVNLTFNYPHWSPDPGSLAQDLFPLGVLVVGVVFLVVARRSRGPLTGYLLFIGTLFPALGFVDVFPFQYSYVADHFAYLASLGCIAPVVVGLTSLVEEYVPQRLGRLGLASFFLFLFASLSWSQSGMYRDAETLYRETAARNPASWLAHNNLGLMLADRQQNADAIREYRAAIDANPKVAEIHNNLGIALGREPGRLPDAIAQFREALRIDPGLATAHNDLALAFAQTPEHLPDAVREYREALRINPDFPEARYNLALALAQIPGRLSDAIAEYRTVLSSNPNLVEAHSNLGIALAQTPNGLPAAVAEFEAALRLSPDAANVHNNLALTFTQMPGRMADAIAEYQKAVELVPNSPELHYSLGMTLLGVPGRQAEAATQFEAALQLRPDFAPAREMLTTLKKR